MRILRDFYLFIGPPGAGKGSLASLCVQTFGWKQLSTGNLCRKHIARETPIGKQIDFAIKSGKLVPDKLITQMVAEWIESKSSSAAAIILDGFPRTASQASGLFDVLHQKFQGSQLHVIQLTLEDVHVIERVAGRAVCENKECQAVYSTIEGSSHASKVAMVCDLCKSSLIKRADDEPEMIKERLAIYYHHEQALLDVLRREGQEIKQLGVNRPLVDVFGEFKKQVVS